MTSEQLTFLYWAIPYIVCVFVLTGLGIAIGVYTFIKDEIKYHRERRGQNND